MKLKFLFLFGAMIFFMSCSKDSDVPLSEDPDYSSMEKASSQWRLQDLAFYGPYTMNAESQQLQTFYIHNFAGGARPIAFSARTKKYYDDGTNGDIVAGDGLFTRKFEAGEAIPNSQNLVSYNEQFGFVTLATSSSFEVPFEDDIVNLRPGLTLGCHVTVGDCPNTNWWNTSYFGEPCVFFHDCYFEVSI